MGRKLIYWVATGLPAMSAVFAGIDYDLDGYEPKSLRGIYGGPHPAFDIQ